MKKLVIYWVALFSATPILYCQNMLTQEWKGTSISMKPLWHLYRTSGLAQNNTSQKPTTNFEFLGGTTEITHRFTPNLDLTLDMSASKFGLGNSLRYGGQLAVGYTKHFDVLGGIGVRINAFQKFGFNPTLYMNDQARGIDAAVYKDWHFKLSRKFTLSPMIGAHIISQSRYLANCPDGVGGCPKDQSYIRSYMPATQHAVFAPSLFAGLNMEYKFSSKVSASFNIALPIPLESNPYALPNLVGQQIGGLKFKF